ncbi:hypothetical protein MASR2M79_22490 [Aminivibrio sp.]
MMHAFMSLLRRKYGGNGTLPGWNKKRDGARREAFYSPEGKTGPRRSGDREYTIETARGGRRLAERFPILEFPHFATVSFSDGSFPQLSALLHRKGLGTTFLLRTGRRG